MSITLLRVDVTTRLIWLQLSHTMLLCQDSLGDELGNEVVQLPCHRSWSINGLVFYPAAFTKAVCSEVPHGVR